MQSLKTGALTGARFDLVDKDSQDDNISGMLKERFPLFDTPLATQDSDSPIMKTVKNVVEGMMIGGVFDSVLYGVTKGQSKEAIENVINSRRKSVKSQQLEEAATQMKEPGFRASKNPKLANKSQGGTTSLETGPALNKARRQKKTQLGSEDGSIGSSLSNTEVTALTKGTKEARGVVEKVLRRLIERSHSPQWHQMNPPMTIGELIEGQLPFKWQGKKSKAIENDFGFEKLRRGLTIWSFLYL